MEGINFKLFFILYRTKYINFHKNLIKRYPSQKIKKQNKIFSAGNCRYAWIRQEYMHELGERNYGYQIAVYPKLTEIFNVKIQDLFDSERRLEISNNTFDNKDNSVGLIITFTFVPHSSSFAVAIHSAISL